MIFTKISVYIFSEKLLQTLKNIGYKTTTVWNSLLLCTVLVCQFHMHKNHKTVPKYFELDFLRKQPFLELRWSKTWTCNQKAKISNSESYLIHMRRKTQLLTGTNVPNSQILLFCNHDWGHPAYIAKSLLVGTGVMLTFLWAITPGNSKSCYLKNSTDYLFSRNNIE